MEEPRLSVVEQPIRTVHREGGPPSYYRTVGNSLRTYFLLLRFAGVAVLSAMVDNAVFYLLFRATANVLQSQVGARFASLLFNYPAVRAGVFRSDESHRILLPRYLLLVGINIALAYALVRLLTGVLSIGVFPAKLLADGLLFFFSFVVQRGVVFVKRTSRKKAL